MTSTLQLLQSNTLEPCSHLFQMFFNISTVVIMINIAFEDCDFLGDIFSFELFYMET